MTEKSAKTTHDPDTIEVSHDLSDPNYELFKQELQDASKS